MSQKYHTKRNIPVLPFSVKRIDRIAIHIRESKPDCHTLSRRTHQKPGREIALLLSVNPVPLISDQITIAQILKIQPVQLAVYPGIVINQLAERLIGTPSFDQIHDVLSVPIRVRKAEPAGTPDLRSAVLPNVFGEDLCLFIPLDLSGSVEGDRNLLPCAI